MSRNRDNSGHLSEHLSDLFWDYDVSTLDWDEHREFICRRVLSHGTWDQIQWLRTEVGDEALRHLITDTEGRDLSPRQLRFWELILDLPTDQVDRWLDESGRKIWDERAR